MLCRLQSPAAARQEEAQLREEMEALTSELREVREARHMLQAVSLLLTKRNEVL